MTLQRPYIKELPTQIGQLPRLRMLDLSNCGTLKVIQPNVISHLTRLEELVMFNTFLNWDQVDVGHGERRIAGLVELKELVQLTALELDILDIKMLPRDLFDEKLERYHFCIQVDDGNDDDDSEDDDDLVDGDIFVLGRLEDSHSV